MRTVEKALKLLDFFSDTVVEVGLSDLARLSGIDKATVLRMLNDMAECGLVEQDPGSRRWRLGAGVLRLARLREAAFPVTRVLAPILDRLAADTGETAHASLRSGRDLGTVGVAESTRSHRVSIEPAQVLPLHATASGLAYTAFARPEQREAILSRRLPAATPATPVTREVLAELVARVRACGFATADQTYEAEVFGIAMPIFGADGFSIGAIAVASPSSRMTQAHRAAILAALGPAIREATQDMGGRMPSDFPPLPQE